MPLLIERTYGKKMSLHNSPASEIERQRARLILQTVLMAQLSTERRQWLCDQLAHVAIEKSNRSVDRAFGLCPIRLGKTPVVFTKMQRVDLQQCMPGWRLDGLSVDAVARMLVLTCFSDAKQLATQLTRLLFGADPDEQVALYRGLPLYPASATVNDRLADGLLRNRQCVIEAIAHHNPYAAWHLDTYRFNRMVLQVLFHDLELAPVVQLEQRNNAELVRLLLNTAHERQAAGQPVPDELWSMTTAFLTHEEEAEFSLVHAA